MTVRCPECNTRYRLPPRSRLGRNPTYRCTRCRHVFAPDEEAEAPALEEPDEPAIVVDDEDDDAPVFTIGPSAPEADEEDDDGEKDAARERRARRGAAPTPAPAEPPSPARFAARAALTVAIVYGILSIYLHTHPERARAFLGALPLIGEEMSDTRLHTGLIQLADVRGEWKRVHGDRLVFVITGTAINNAPVAVATVQIQGRVLGDRPEPPQVVYCGAAPEDVGDLGIREIELLQTLKPSSDWVLRPGGQDRFLIAFVDPPVPLTEFTAEVVAVRGTAPRGDGPMARRP